MPIACFLDTNVLIYAAATRDDPRKHAIASEIVLSQAFGISGQVLAEFYDVARKARVALSDKAIEEWFDLFEDLPVSPVDVPLVRTGILYSRRYRISYWDGAILAAAERLGAPILYTEDLGHGQLYGSVRVVNPFLPA